MKTVWVLIGVISVVIVLHAFKAAERSGISGRLTPANGGQMIWAIRGTDTLKWVPSDGDFLIEARPGLYNIFVDTKQPFKDVLLENVRVSNGRTTDVGVIKLSK